MQDIRKALKVSGEKVTQVLGSQFKQGLEDHCFRFTSDKLFNGLLSQLVDKWSAWGSKAAVGYNSSCSILKFLQLIKLSRPAQPQTEQQYQKCGLTIPV